MNISFYELIKWLHYLRYTTEISSRINNIIIDTIKLAKQEFPGQAVNLDSLCRKLNVNNTRQNYHGALLDATLLSKVYLKLTTGKQGSLKLIDNKLFKIDENKNINHYKNNFLIPRDKLMNLSGHEKREHENFINKMKNPIWKRIK